MKQIPTIFVLGFALTLCNLGTKLKTASKSGGSEKSTSSSSGEAEKATPTAAQTQALAGGKEIKWNRQGMSWTAPAQWKEDSSEAKELVWSSPGGDEAAHLIVSISPMDDSFPTESSIQAFYDQAETRMKHFEVDELKWLEIDGLKGVQFRESNPEKPGDFRRLQWMAYRKYGGQVQMVDVMLSSNGRGFPKHQDEMYGVLYSTKLVH
ncbi:MAG: hypothetical protein ABJB61_13455 [bacterium]